MKKILSIVLIGTLFIVGCSKDDNTPAESSKAQTFKMVITPDAGYIAAENELTIIFNGTKNELPVKYVADYSAAGDDDVSISADDLEEHGKITVKSNDKVDYTTVSVVCSGSQSPAQHIKMEIYYNDKLKDTKQISVTSSSTTEFWTFKP